MQFKLKVESSIHSVDAESWNLCAGSHLFLQHEFLSALETSGAFGRPRGVIPKYLLLYDTQDQLLACAPGMLKWNTVREYGPEAIWLKQGLAQGVFQWPKFQLGVPFFPSIGPRLLVNPQQNRKFIEKTLLHALFKVIQKIGAPSIFDIMHIDAQMAKEFKEAGALISYERQSFWYNKNHISSDAYLETLSYKKRLQFRQERKAAIEHGMDYRILRGTDITESVIEDYYEGHCRVCARHGHLPWLSVKTYRNIIRTMKEKAYLLGYFNKTDQLIAGCLGLHSKTENILYLLQWSEMYKLDRLALDIICYRPIDLAIEQNITKIDSGLMAPHKQLRGWLTEPVYHAHWFYESALQTLALKQFTFRQNVFTS
jgi:predicted N-acyltransferase